MEEFDDLKDLKQSIFDQAVQLFPDEVSELDGPLESSLINIVYSLGALESIDDYRIRKALIQYINLNYTE